MATIFTKRDASSERWLTVSDDGQIVYNTENEGWKLARKGLEHTETQMTAKQAKDKWPEYALDIDNALAPFAKKPI